MENNEMKTENNTRIQSEKLVAAIDNGSNVHAQDILANILAKKVEVRYDDVMKKNG